MKIEVTRTTPAGVSTTEVKEVGTNKEAGNYLTEIHRQKMQSLFDIGLPGQKYTSDKAITKPYYATQRKFNPKGEALLNIPKTVILVRISHE